MDSPAGGPGRGSHFVGEYFDAGARLVWYLDPRAKTAEVYYSVEERAVVSEDGSLDGGEVLPGFSLSLRDWSERAGEQSES